MGIELRHDPRGNRASSAMQHILVCAQDSVLAKKIRFLLARDECEVEILPKASQLEHRLHEGGIELLITSRQLDGEDAIDLISRFDPALSLPPTIILGGASTKTADFIKIVPDPIDTQAIYRIASEALTSTSTSQGKVDFGDEELTEATTRALKTHAAIPNPARPGRGQLAEETSLNATNPALERTAIAEIAAESQEEDPNFTDVTGLDEIAANFDELEASAASTREARDPEVKAAPVQATNPPRARTQQKHDRQDRQDARHPDASTLEGSLEPARFARALFSSWAKQVTGALIISREHETLTIHFESGSPVAVESSISGDQLGRSLVNRGRITEAQYADAAKRAIERGLRLGQALVDLAFFTHQELGRELGATAREQIVGCFAARQGTFEFDAKRAAPTEERPYLLAVGHILAEGFKRYCDEAVLREVSGDIDSRYFKVTKSPAELAKIFPLEPKEVAFLEFSGRAYNVSDAAEVSGIDLFGAHKLMALLITCEEIEDFTPGVREFEARISEERQRSREAESKTRSPSELLSGPRPEPARAPEDRPRRTNTEEMRLISERRPPVQEEPPVPANVRKIPSQAASYGEPAPPPPPPPSQSFHGTVAAPPPSAPQAGPADSGVPPMPVPNPGEGTVPRPLVYAKPLPRSNDGTPIETQERTLSREHFQRGVTLLGQGNFASAEEAFRDAVALCSEEHVYLIGLARAIYYNPGYRAEGKVPVLKAIVGRAEQLAPDDNRVATLSTWIANAESQMMIQAQMVGR